MQINIKSHLEEQNRACLDGHLKQSRQLNRGGTREMSFHSVHRIPGPKSLLNKTNPFAGLRVAGERETVQSMATY